MYGPPLFETRLKPIWAICYPMCCDGIKELLVESFQQCRVAFTLHGNYRLKSFECLDGALEANGAWFDSVPSSGLSHDRLNKVECQDVGPEFLAYQFWSLAPQDPHLHRLF
jgi:hypothetical protein